MSFTWQNGRQLATLTKNGSTYNYIYNPDGVRIGKSGAKNVTYEVAGTQILKETIGSTVIYYHYDEKGSPVGLTYNGTDYYYRKNLQGDIIEILDNSKTSVVQYTYNAWGKLLSMSGTLAGTVGLNNGLRYRGYYFDNESSLYYLNSRYYDPSTGRFVNADSLASQESVIGNNLFVYCLNNPVNMSDESGNLPFFAITAIVGAVVGAVVGGVTAAMNGGDVLAGVGTGAAAGALIGTGVGAAAGVALAGSITASTAAVASGAGMLVTAVSTGGAGAGLALVADNISRAANNVGTVLYSGGEQARQAATTFANNTGGTTIDPTVIGQVADAATKVPGADFTTVWS